MKLGEYIQEEGLKIEVFARKVGVSPQTITNIIKGYDTHLSVALSIEDVTKGCVRCRDLRPYKSRKPRGKKLEGPLAVSLKGRICKDNS